MKQQSRESAHRWWLMPLVSVRYTIMKWTAVMGASMLALTLPAFGADAGADLTELKQPLPPGLSSQDWRQVRAQIENSRRNDSAARRGDTQSPLPDTANGVITQTDYIKPFNTDNDDSFGFSIALHGTTLVVGAPHEDSTGVGDGGNPTSNSAANAGAAYVFERGNNGWYQEAYLKASNADTGDEFGYSVAVFGDTIVVGARLEDGSGSGINPPHNNSFSNAGAAYIFVRQGGVWFEQAILKASNPSADDHFGNSVDIYDQTVIVGAPREDFGVTDSGAAYIFVRQNNVWSQQALLRASSRDTSDLFGISVAVTLDRAIVGAYLEDSPSSVVNGSQGNHSSYTDSGAAYIFSRSSGSWSQQAYLKAPNVGAHDRFGVAVDISGGIAVVGAYLEDSSSTGADGNLYNDSAGDSGAAYIFTSDQNGNWFYSHYLKATNTGSSDWFGLSVSISGNIVLVGARIEDGGSNTVNGQSNNNVTDSGAAYLYIIDDATANAVAYIKPTNVGASDLFGYSVAVSGDGIAIGAEAEDSTATSVNGDEHDNNATNAGAAYLFSGTSSFYSVGGTVIGLAEGNTLVLQNNETEDLTITSNGTYRFPVLYTDGTSYSVTVASHPTTPRQDCLITNGSGLITSAAVEDVLVDCRFRTLSVPRNLNSVDSSFITVPVHLEPGGASISSVAFSLDYDETCLNPDMNNDGALDSALLNVPGDFTSTILFDPTDTDGEIDISIVDFTPPISALNAADILNIAFFTDCQGAGGGNFTEAMVRFSGSPQPSFGDLAAGDVEGTWSDGIVRVWAGAVGDCNISGGLSAADLTAVGLEIFDNDGDFYIDAPASEFFGSPMGCDANGGETITAADVTCANVLLFGGSCAPGRASAGGALPEINTSTYFEEDVSWIRVTLAQHTTAIGGVAFALDLDPAVYDFTLMDLDRNGVPDRLRFPAGQPGLAAVQWNADDSEGELDVLLVDLAANQLVDGIQVEIGIPSPRAVDGGLQYGAQPPPSFSTSQGGDVPGLATLGDVIYSAGFESETTR